ncbi:MAG: acetate--CoA ligase [Candidatus Eutrophobiaceae bacterium]
MTDIKHPVPTAAAQRAHIDRERYETLYRHSINDPEGFWANMALETLDWFKPWNRVLDWDFHKAHIKWFQGGKLNVSWNCLDRHLQTKSDQTAIIWEGDDPSKDRRISYRELHGEVCRFANVLKAHGIRKGDRVCLYMPMIPEAAVAMLACTRIGAVHSVVFGGFSPNALRDRINDADCCAVITADFGLRGAKRTPLKENVDEALKDCPNVRNCIVIRHTGDKVAWVENRDLWYHEEMQKVDAECPAEEMDAEDPLFILYTSGSTGKPKGVLHSTGGYLLHAALSHKYVFDYHDGDIYWCSADVGWVTGHSYIIYGPLANGACTLMFEGVPTYPDAGRFWQVVEKWKVNIFYTSPTAIRLLMGQGDEFVFKHDRSSLRTLGTVGEPINPEAWNWYHRIVGEERCPIVDTWWQTETGGILITPLPGAIEAKPGSATLPFFGVEPCLVDDQGNELQGAAKGILCIKRPWPGMMRTVYGDHKRFFETYFRLFPGKYFTGDGARRDEDGYYWITGRIDDVINVAGHRMGTAEIESALVLHNAVAEAAVVGYPHDVKGQGIYSYVTLMVHIEASEELRKELIKHVRSVLGPIATPDIIQWVPSLPKTRSGKIMRRILRKVAANEFDSLGDISTLADPLVVDRIIQNRAIK